MILNGIANYKNMVVATNTEDKGALLLKVFQLTQEKICTIISCVDSRDYEKKYKELSKVKQVIEILHDSVDTQYGDIATNLKSLYLYILKRLNEANINNSKYIFEECKSLLRILYEGFEEVYKKEKTKNMNTHDSFLNITVNHKSF